MSIKSQRTNQKKTKTILHTLRNSETTKRTLIQQEHFNFLVSAKKHPKIASILKLIIGNNFLLINKFK